MFVRILGPYFCQSDIYRTFLFREQLEEKVTLVQAHRVRLENRALLEMSRDQLEIQVPRANPVTKEPRE